MSYSIDEALDVLRREEANTWLRPDASVTLEAAFARQWLRGLERAYDLLTKSAATDGGGGLMSDCKVCKDTFESGEPYSARITFQLVKRMSGAAHAAYEAEAHSGTFAGMTERESKQVLRAAEKAAQKKYREVCD